MDIRGRRRVAIDANGNTTSSAGIQNIYDFENRMTQRGTGLFLTYDGDGNRVSETIGRVVWCTMRHLRPKNSAALGSGNVSHLPPPETKPAKDHEASRRARPRTARAFFGISYSLLERSSLQWPESSDAILAIARKFYDGLAFEADVASAPTIILISGTTLGLRKYCLPSL